MRIFLTGFLVLAGSGGVFAQDANDWTGFHAGVGLSASQAQVDPDVSTLSGLVSGLGSPSSTRLLDELLPGQADSVSLSLFTGYGLQLGSAFVGIEGDLDLAPSVFTNEAFVEFGSLTCTAFCTSSNGSVSFDTLGRLRALVGVVIEPTVMGFVAGGVAIAQANAELSTKVIVPGILDEDAATSSELIGGITLGAGVEIKATGNLRIRAEALIDSFAPWSYDLQSASSATVPEGHGSLDYDLAGDAVFANVSGRVALVWQF